MFQQCWLAKKTPRQFLENESKQKWCLNLLAAVVFFQKSPDHKSPSTGVAAFRSHSSIELQHDKISVKMKPGLWQRSQSKHEAAVSGVACEIGFRGCSQESNRGTGPVYSFQPLGPGYRISNQEEHHAQ